MILELFLDKNVCVGYERNHVSKKNQFHSVSILCQQLWFEYARSRMQISGGRVHLPSCFKTIVLSSSVTSADDNVAMDDWIADSASLRLVATLEVTVCKSDGFTNIMGEIQSKDKMRLPTKCVRSNK